MENKTDYITHLEFERAKGIWRVELNDKFSKVDEKIGNVDDKVDNLRDIVLPMVESSKQTAENTKKIAESMERFTAEQRTTNGKFYSKFNEHDVIFADVKGQFDAVGIRLNSRSEEKKNNTALWTAILVAITGIITAIFQAAPALFN